MFGGWRSSGLNKLNVMYLVYIWVLGIYSMLVYVETRQSNLAVKGRRSSGLSGQEQRSEAVDALMPRPTIS